MEITHNLAENSGNNPPHGKVGGFADVNHSSKLLACRSSQTDVVCFNQLRSQYRQIYGRSATQYLGEGLSLTRFVIWAQLTSGLLLSACYRFSYTRIVLLSFFLGSRPFLGRLNACWDTIPNGFTAIFANRFRVFRWLWRLWVILSVFLHGVSSFLWWKPAFIYIYF